MDVMKRLFFRRAWRLGLATFTCLSLMACSDDGSTACPDGGPIETDAYPALDPGTECRIDRLLYQMTLEEKVNQMHGTDIVPVYDLYETPDNQRLGIPGYKMVDGPRGVRAGYATTFPVGMARGATWDPDLERRVGEAMGLEVRAKGGNVLLAPTVNLLRHPGWGRAQETYGEDPHHLARMGVAFIQGVQRHVIASVKHFAANSIEDTRFELDVTVDERTLREIYLPHFKAAVQEARAGSVMSAYNLVNGFYCAENERLLRDILKGEWGFDGFVESDWIWGTRSTIPSALAGLDIEMPAPMYYKNVNLIRAVENGDIPEAVIDEAVRRILRKKLQFRLDDPTPVSPDVVESPEHVALALEAAHKSIVLLKNEAGALPLDLAAVDHIAVVGALADATNLGDRGSSNCQPSRAVTPYAGIEALAASDATVSLVATDTLSPADATLVAAADVAVVVVGLTHLDEGEYIPGSSAGDRDHLNLSAVQEALIAEVASLSSHTIVVLEGGSAITMSPWLDLVPAVLMAWYPGMAGGTAIADILFGEVNPSGKLPSTFPADLGQLPPFIHDQLAVTYGYYHGYRHVDREGIEPLYPFGFGLSYTTFSLLNLGLSTTSPIPDDVLTVSVDVTNTGNRAGAEVVQLYVGYPASGVDRPVRDLKAFSRVALTPGETRTVALPIKVQDLAYYDTNLGEWVVAPGDYDLFVGTSSRDLPLQASINVQ